MRCIESSMSGRTSFPAHFETYPPRRAYVLIPDQPFVKAFEPAVMKL
jgi:hypothetical protein